MSLILEEATRLHRAGELTSAERLYRCALAAEPDNPQACHWLGMLLFHIRRVPEALELVERSVRMSPLNAGFQNNLAAVLGSVGRTAEAIVVARKAIDQRPDFAGAWHTLAVALDHSREFDDSVAAFGRALALRPDDPTAHTNHGKCALEAGKGRGLDHRSPKGY